MGLYCRGKIYWFSFMFEGKRVQTSLNTDKKKVAEKRAAKITSDMVDGKYFEKEKAKRITFKEMADKYQHKYGKSRDETSLKKLLPFFGDLRLSQITTELVSDYKDERRKTVKPATVYQELSLMRRMFNVARKEWRWVTENPTANLSFSVGNSNARDRWLTPEEEIRLLANAARPVWFRPLLMAALHTGMRKGELLRLKWQDIDFKRRLILVDRSKNGLKRSVPMTETLSKTLTAQKVRDISGRVFPVSDSSVRDAFLKAVRRARIDDFRFHDLRHTFATRLVQSGVDLYRVKELLGHKTITMTTRYAHHCPESLRQSVKTLDDCYNFATVEGS